MNMGIKYKSVYTTQRVGVNTYSCVTLVLTSIFTWVSNMYVCIHCTCQEYPYIPIDNILGRSIHLGCGYGKRCTHCLKSPHSNKIFNVLITLHESDKRWPQPSTLSHVSLRELKLAGYYYQDHKLLTEKKLHSTG